MVEAVEAVTGCPISKLCFSRDSFDTFCYGFRPSYSTQIWKLLFGKLSFFKFVKGQIISKRFFPGRGFFQKTNENTSHTSKNEFIRSFFGRILGLTMCF